MEGELSIGQRKALSDFLSTVAAAWFTAGVISPLFTHPEDSLEAALLVVLSLAVTAAFLRLSLVLVKEVGV